MSQRQADSLIIEHLRIPKVSDIPEFMLQAKENMQSIGPDYDIHMFDIEWCFPHMPKSAIKMATMEVISSVRPKGCGSESITKYELDSKQGLSMSTMLEHLGV